MRDTRRSRIVLAILVLVSITLIVFDLRGGESGPTRPLRVAGETVLGSAERAMATFVVPVRGLIESLGGLGDADARIAQLEADNARLQAELDTVANDRARVADLEALLGLVSTNDYETVPAQVIAVGPAQGFAWTVTIDAGSRDGVERDMSVISGAGLVGRRTARSLDPADRFDRDIREVRVQLDGPAPPALIGLRVNVGFRGDGR